MKYIKKPVEIEARRLPTHADREDYKNFEYPTIEYLDECIDLADWCGGVSHMMHEDSERHLDHILIPTLEGNMKAYPGDYIIKGVKGEFYPCKPDIFEMTYEKVEPNFETYCIEVTRDSEEPFVFHAKFDHQPTRQEILDEIEDQELNYDDNYGKIDFYKVG